MKELIRRVSGPGPCEAREVGLLHRLLGETFAAAARAAADQASLGLQQVQVIGCPGHTVWHDTEGRFPSTLPLGMAAVVAERCGVTTVSDFRCRDVAAGGLGVPLAALTDYLLFRSPRESRAVVHLGATARVVFLPAAGRPADATGFEAGPCNVLLDALMRHVTGGRAGFDAGGKHAVQGKCVEPLARAWLAHPYFSRRPPKCLPRHVFGDAFAAEALHQARDLQASLHDLLCTATHFVARGVASALQRFLPSGRRPDRIFLSGGGVRNGLLWRLLEQQLPGHAAGPHRRGRRSHRRPQGVFVRPAGGADGGRRERQRAVGHRRRGAAPAGQPDAGFVCQLGAVPGVDGGPVAAAGGGLTPSAVAPLTAI